MIYPGHKSGILGAKKSKKKNDTQYLIPRINGNLNKKSQIYLGS
jgi:hypothetical protein